MEDLSTQKSGIYSEGFATAAIEEGVVVGGLFVIATIVPVAVDVEEEAVVTVVRVCTSVVDAMM